MVFSLADLCEECSSVTAPTSYVVASSVPRSADTYKRVWMGFVKIIKASLRAGKGLRAPNLARWTFLRTTKKPIFAPCEPFTRSYNVTAPALLPDLQVPCVDINFARLSATVGGMDNNMARGMFETLVACLGQQMNKGTRMRITLPGVGVLAADNRQMRFRFTEQIVDDSGKGAPPQYTARSARGVRPETTRSRSMPTLDIDPAVQTPLVGVETVMESASARGRKQASLRDSYRRMLVDKQRSARQQEDEERRQHREQLQRHKQALEREQQAREAAAHKAQDLQADLRAQSEAKQERARTAAQLDRMTSDDDNFLRLRSDEDINTQRRIANQTLRMELDEQVGQKKLSRSRSNSETVRSQARASLKKATARQKDNVYPKFLVPCNEDLLKGGISTDSVSRNSRMAFEALEKQLKAQAERARKFESDQEEAKKKGEEILRARAQAKRRQQVELNEFLIQQAEHKRELDRKEKLSRFLEQSPNPSAAYPVEQERDVSQVVREKAKLKAALDRQVQVKQERARQQRMLDHQEDRFYLQCVHQQLQQDREFRKQKKKLDRSTLAEAWREQRQMNSHLKDLALQSQ